MLAFALLCAALLWYKKWYLYLLCLLTAVIPITIQNYVVQPRLYNGITGGPVAETMSIPTQQTARYLLMHMSEVTEEERAVLSDVFEVPIEMLPVVYRPESSDTVKGEFLEHPSKEQLQAYYRVWFAQMRKHPATYVQAFLNMCYGYFYPNREIQYDTTARYNIGIDQEWTDSMDVHFGIKNKSLRTMVENNAELFRRLPLLGMLYSAGFHNYVLLGCAAYLCSRRKKKELTVLLPALGVVLFNLFSPLNAYPRYMLPVMAMLPFLIAWCYYVTRPDKTDQT